MDTLGLTCYVSVLQEELKSVMRLLGARNVAELGSKHVGGGNPDLLTVPLLMYVS